MRHLGSRVRRFGRNAAPGCGGLRWARLLLPLLVLAALVLAPTAVASPDFQITVSPSSQRLQPGSSVSFAIGIGSIEGFSAPVTLSVGGLPSGVSAAFSPNPITPPGTSFLTLTAAANAPTGTFAFTITATGGGISHDATGSAKVDFGLVPVCYGQIHGLVTDAETHASIGGVTVTGPGTTTTAADGSYSFDQVPLGENNSPVEVAVRASKDPPLFAHIGSYWDKTGTVVVSPITPASAGCTGTPTEIDFAMVPVHPAYLAGTIVEGNPDPSDYSHVIPTSTPIQGARPALSYLAPEVPFTTGADGHYDLSFHVDENNTPIEPALNVTVPDLPYRHGYWGRDVNVGQVAAGQHVALDVALVKQCTASISGHVIYGDTGLPAGNANVSAGNAAATDIVPFTQVGDSPITTDAQGTFSIPEILIGVNNQPVKLGVHADAPAGYLEAGESSPDAIGCGGRWDVTLVLQPFSQTSNFGTVEGHVYDQETGAPIADATVEMIDPPDSLCAPPAHCETTTDSHGFYRLDPVRVSFDSSVTTVTYNAGAAHDPTFRSPPPDYYCCDAARVDVTAGTTAVHDFHLLRRRYGRLTGVVRDSITGAPIAGAGVSYPCATNADENGRYETGLLGLDYPNAPTSISCRFVANGYWYKDITATIRADETTQQDVDLLPICHATITGKVVDANTQLPIRGASVGGGGVNATTDANGDYRLENVTVGYDNSPIDVGVTASAPGYYTQTKTVTVFCGGTIIVNFGSSTGHIVVVKRTIPAGSTQSFNFTANWGSVFSLTDGASRDSGPIAAGSGYSVSESLPEGWTQTGASCSDGSPVTHIDLSPGETVTCTVTNQHGGQPPGRVVVTKSCPNGAAADGDLFQVTDNGQAVGNPLACSGSLDVSVAAGSAYAIDEQAAGTADLDNYMKQLSAGCSGTLTSGGSARCTITNTLKQTGTPCPPSGSVSVRWHYSANGSSGSWSATKSTSCKDGSVAIGPQAMEGDLKLSAGTTLKVGYDFTLAGNKQSFTAKVSSAQVVFTVRCVTGSPLVSTWTVPIPDQKYSVSGSAWFPSGDQKSLLVYQGLVTVPGTLCSSGQVRLDKGGTFSATILLS
jgi:Carboxypeptidase regulatory-like domain